MEGAEHQHHGSGLPGDGTMPDGDETDDAAAAFMALRSTMEDLAADLGRDMGVIRKGVEAALIRFERQGVPVDYGADLARLTQGLAVVGERLGAVEQAPVLRQGAEHYARVLERSGEGLVRTALQGLERQAADLERIGQGLTWRLEGARERRDQNRWLVSAGAGAFVVGVLATLFMPLTLPGPIGRFVASTALGADQWNAGAALMQSGSPEGWQALLEAHNLAQANKEALAGCREAAAKAGKEERCSIMVARPERAR